MPRERGALHPHRERRYALEDLELRGQLPLRLAPGGQFLVETLEEPVGFLDGLPLQGVGHQRGGGFGDGAPGSLKPRVRHHPVLDLEHHPEAVAAEGVVPLRLAAVCPLDHPEVPGRPVVVEDHALVEFVEVAHQAKRSRASCSPTTSWSMSSRVLYTPREARTVAGSRSTCISGWAQ